MEAILTVGIVHQGILQSALEHNGGLDRLADGGLTWRFFASLER
jgi:hypothetical protein